MKYRIEVLLSKLVLGDLPPIQLNWQRTHQWDFEHSNSSDLRESDANPDKLDVAIEIERAEPSAAFLLWNELAEAGSIFAMSKLAWCYHAGAGTGKNEEIAERWYRAGASGGSQWALLRTAALVAARGDYAESDKLLAEQAKAEWIPALFWQAWYRTQSSPTPSIFMEVRDLLEQSSAAGHPGARWYLARLMAQGKYGAEERKHGRERLVVLGGEVAQLAKTRVKK